MCVDLNSDGAAELLRRRIQGNVHLGPMNLAGCVTLVVPASTRGCSRCSARTTTACSQILAVPPSSKFEAQVSMARNTNPDKIVPVAEDDDGAYLPWNWHFGNLAVCSALVRACDGEEVLEMLRNFDRLPKYPWSAIPVCKLAFVRWAQLLLMS